MSAKHSNILVNSIWMKSCSSTSSAGLQDGSLLLPGPLGILSGSKDTACNKFDYPETALLEDQVIGILFDCFSRANPSSHPH